MTDARDAVRIGTAPVCTERHDGNMSRPSLFSPPRIDPAPVRPDRHRTEADSPVRPGINPQTPDTMTRAEDDVTTRRNSPEFHDRPGSGKHIGDRKNVF